MPDPRRVAVLISGRGSNLQALVGQADGYRVVLVASNRPEAQGLDWARIHDIPTWCWDSQCRSRDEFDAALTEALALHDVGTIALAGYMRLLSPGFVARWRGRIVNIHPSLLPAYKGLDTHARAIAAGEREHGCSVHLVTEALDEGAVLASARVAIRPTDSAAVLAERVLKEEHRLYPEALAAFIRASEHGGRS